MGLEDLVKGRNVLPGVTIRIGRHGVQVTWESMRGGAWRRLIPAVMKVCMIITAVP